MNKRSQREIDIFTRDMNQKTRVTRDVELMHKHLAKLVLADVFRSMASRLFLFGFVIRIPEPFTLKNYPNWRIEIMPKKANSDTSKKSSIGEWKGLVRVPFGKDDKAGMDAWIQSIDIEVELSELVAADYKVSLSLDSNHNAFLCSVSCYDPESPNFKHTMTSRAHSPSEAMFVALYKHIVISERNWNSSIEDSIYF